ncbi:MAG: DUF6249 domain-containing protein [Francisellaceae bacterium]
MDFGLLVPLAPFIMVVLVIFILVNSSRKKEHDYQQTIRKMIDSGEGISEEFIKQHGFRNSIQGRFNRGIKLICIGIALAIILFLITGWNQYYWSWGLLPMAFGIGELIIAKLMSKDQDPR